MNSRFMTRERRYLLIIGGILLLGAVLYRFYPWGMMPSEDPSGTELKQRKLAGYLSVVQQKPVIEKQIMQMDRVYNELSKSFLNGDTPALAAVDIQNTLSRIAETVSVSIRRIDIIKEKKFEDQALISVPVRFSMESTTAQLRDMIYHIESSDKLLRVTDVQLNVRSVRYPEVIASTITVEGFIHE